VTNPSEDEVDIPNPVRHLAGEVLHNVSELEAVLLARRWPQHIWNAGAVSRSLKIGHGQAADALTRLATVGLINEIGPDSYRYHPATPETSRTLDDLSALYHSRRQTVLRLLFARAKGAVTYFPPDATPGGKK
jgi:hypothetical protein